MPSKKKSNKVHLTEIKKKDEKNKKLRNYLITINNPKRHHLDRDLIFNDCIDLEPQYFCLSEEVGLQEKTPHIHVFIKFKNPRSFMHIKKTFPMCHVDRCEGTDIQCIDYVFKEGEWSDDPKGETNLRDTHMEWGDKPQRPEKKEPATSVIKRMVDDGVDTADIVDIHPNFALRTRQIDTYAEVVKRRKFKKYLKERRLDIDVTYIFGPPGTGKSRYINDKFEGEMCIASDYKQPFETYDYQNVMAFEEFRSDIPCKQMLRYIDIYPCTLPHRYNNKFACYHKVYIVSNINLDEQYQDVQKSEPTTWKAFLRRIHHVIEFCDNGEKRYYNTLKDYKENKFITLEEFEHEKHEQIKLV